MKGITKFTPSTLSINSNYGIVYTSWNKEIVSSLLESTTKELLSLGVNKNNISVMEVPGAFEVPLASKSLASKVDAVIALGAIVSLIIGAFGGVAFGNCCFGILALFSLLDGNVMFSSMLSFRICWVCHFVSHYGAADGSHTAEK